MYCPRCGSKDLIRHGWQWRLKSKKRKVQRYRCRSCGHFTVYPARRSQSEAIVEAEADSG